MKKEILVIGLVLIIYYSSMAFVAAEPNITFIYPAKVYVGQEFNATIILNNFSEASYDVKIEILNESHNIAERFFLNEWQSTNFWMNDAINTTDINVGTFRLKITEDYSGTNTINVKIRKGSDIYEFSGYPIQIINNPTNPIQNTTQNNSNPVASPTPVPTSNNPVTVSLDWNEDDIVNGDEFEINVQANNLDNKKYDVKVYIFEDDPDVPISQTENENGDWFASSRYYLQFFSGPGNVNKKIWLRMKNTNSEFHGSASIGVKIREISSGKVVATTVADIDVLEAKKNAAASASTNTNSNTKTKTSTSSNSIDNSVKTGKVSGTKSLTSKSQTTGNTIKLGTTSSDKILLGENLKTQGNTLYESKNEIIKKIAIYSFAGLCLLLCVLLIFLKF